MIPTLHKISDNDLLQTFASRYEKVSGLPIPESYLMSRDVYGFFFRNRLVGGFILGIQSPSRTIAVFADKQHQRMLHQLVKGINFCEVCSFWIEKTYRKKPLSYWLWMGMAVKLYRLKSRYLLFGTNSKGLARLYSYPRKCCLLHQDKVLTNIGSRDTWIFIGRRKDIITGVLEIFLLKLTNCTPFNKERCSVLEEISEIREFTKAQLYN